MATRFYFSEAAESTPISPAVRSSWEDSSIMVRVLTDTAKRSLPMTDVAFTDASAADKDICFRQHISKELTVGQTVTGSQTIKAQFRVSEEALSGNMFFALCVRVMASDGTTERKVLIDVTRDNVEAVVSVLTNRQFSTTSTAGNYTTVAGDRFVIETGMGGDPGLGGVHDSTMRYGDASGTDLPENDTSTSDFNPWVELADTLTFVAPAAGRFVSLGGFWKSDTRVVLVG